jgi:hypothetical protein
MAYTYEPITLSIGVGCRYTPDFRVVQGRGQTHWYEMHEVKGTVHRGRERGLVKLKAAARQYPEYRWFLAERVAGQWQVEEIRP